MAELENGDVLPSISTLRTLCLILDVSADYLLFGYRTVPLKSRK
jgi:transcriptional regulator with XRE-family HTH domain